MSSKKLVPNGETAPEGSVGSHGNRWTNGIGVALSGLTAAVVLLLMVREIVSIRDQQMVFMREIRDIRDQQAVFMKQQTDLRGELQGLKDQDPAGSTDDWRRDESATFWKSAEVHRRSKRNSEAKTTWGVCRDPPRVMVLRRSQPQQPRLLLRMSQPQQPRLLLLQAQIDQTPRHGTLILMGDFNAKVGADNEDYKACMGREGVDGGTSNQIDHICINRKWRRSLLDAKTIRGADGSSDHHLITTKT
ncbi:hypothetical protein Bbelb_118060 [Branchiostoma belcheri]|nr:hypothetical protein Bbelb_118060 [Branchiostoma belcheri]